MISTYHIVGELLDGGGAAIFVLCHRRDHTWVYQPLNLLRHSLLLTPNTIHLTRCTFNHHSLALGWNCSFFIGSGDIDNCAWGAPFNHHGFNVWLVVVSHCVVIKLTVWGLTYEWYLSNATFSIAFVSQTSTCDTCIIVIIVSFWAPQIILIFALRLILDRCLSVKFGQMSQVWVFLRRLSLCMEDLLRPSFGVFIMITHNKDDSIALLIAYVWLAHLIPIDGLGCDHTCAFYALGWRRLCNATSVFNTTRASLPNDTDWVTCLAPDLCNIANIACSSWLFN